MKNKRIKKLLNSWMTWCRIEQAMTALTYPSVVGCSYPPDKSAEYRQGFLHGLEVSESHLGLLMFEQGIDLRPKKQGAAEEGDYGKVHC